MDSKQQEYIQNLYTRFHNESKNGNPSTASYSEEELLDIFDFAGDMGDDFTQLMVLLKANTEYPNDEELTERKAIFATFNTGGNVFVQDFLDGHSHESPLWDVMRIFNLRPDSATTRMFLDKLLARYDEFDDETLIRLVDLIAEFNQFDWLMDNLATLRKKSLYPETLLHEAVQECVDRGLTSRAIELLLELTEEEPFDPTYWRLLAQQYIASDNLREAMNAVDYALAIDGNDLNTRMLKAQITFDLVPNHGDALEVMAQLWHENPDDPTVTFLYAQMLTLSGRSDESREMVTSALANSPTDLSMIQGAMLIHDPELTERVLSDYLDNAVDLTDEAIEQYCNHLVEVKCPRESVVLMLLWYYRNNSTLLIGKLLYGLYGLRGYDVISGIIINIGGKRPKANFAVLTPTEWTMGMLSLARTPGHRDAAISLAESMATLEFSQIDTEMRLAATAAVAIGVTVSRMLADSPDADCLGDELLQIDPFQQP